MVEKDEGLPIGTVLLDRYRIERKIGEGGMSHVYLSSDQWRKETFAVIKMPFLKLLEDRWIAKKFKQEAEALARLKHPGIVELIGHGGFEKLHPFVVLEYVEGATLTTVMDKMPSNPKRAVKLLLQIVEAVEHAHINEVFHRDLKPDNVMVRHAGTENEAIKLIDFGIARIDNSFFITASVTNARIGTPHYISPNRLDNDPDDRADDVYALGLIAYEMMTGTNPLRAARNFIELKLIQERISPPRHLNLNLPRSVDREIIKALSVDQSKRHKSPLEFGQLLYDAFYKQKPKPANIAPELEKTRLYPAANDVNQPSVPTITLSEDVSSAETENFEEERLLERISAGEKFLIGGHFDAAIIFYNEIIRTNERSDVFYSRRAMAFLLKKELENAALDCQKALKLYPDNDFAHLIRGIIYRLKLWSDEAETALLKAVHINQKNIAAALILGDIYASRGETEKALNYYSHITRINPDFGWTYTNRGNLYYNRRDYDAAIADLTSAIKHNPDLDWNYFQRGKARIKNKKYEEAIKDFNRAITLNPKSATFYNERAKLFFNLGKTKEALEDFNRVKELSARESYVPEVTMDKDKKSGLASLTDYLKWVLMEESKS